MFYNTGIATYVWILSNKKSDERKGKVQLINGVNLCGKMRKSLGSKRNEMGSDDIATITRSFGAFEVEDARELDKPAEVKSNRGRQSANPKAEVAKTFASKIFDTHEFGYRRISIERPLRESYQFSDERITELRFAPKPLNAPMKWVYETFGQEWSDKADCENYGALADNAVEIRVHIKANFSELKEAKIKELLDNKTWNTQKQVLLKAKQLQQSIGGDQYDDMNGYDVVIKSAVKSLDIKLETKELKQITTAVSWKNPEAEKVIKNVHKNTAANPLYGLFDVDGQTIEYKPDGDLRDNENVALDPSQQLNALNEAYFKKEVQPHVPDAWIDASKKDNKDQEIGIVGYEIPFNRHFYQYQPPRDLVDIDADLDAVSAEIMNLLREVHS
jgi:type I restriction enzyme M protein